MNLKASAPKGEIDVLTLCGHLDMRATRPGEAQFLAALHRVIYSGGTVRIVPAGGKAVEVEFGGPVVPSGGVEPEEDA